MIKTTRAQTPIFLQKALVNELKEITKDMLFQSQSQKKPVSIKVYEQSLPITQRREPPPDDEGDASLDFQDLEEEPIFQCPWCIVKIEGGNIQGINAQQEVTVSICFGIFNENEDNNGHMEIMDLVQRVYERFAVNPVLDSQYTCQGNFEWAVQEEDTYPFFFGALLTSFKFQGFRRENIFL